MRYRVSSVILVLLAAVPAARAEHVRLDPEVRPTRQSVDLRLDPRGDAYSGSVTIDLNLSRPAERVRLHAEGLTIRTARLGGADAAWANGPDGTLDVAPARLLGPGEVRLEIEFENDYEANVIGLYKMKRDAGYLFTQFQSIDARKAFPCFDEPGFKIPWRLSLEVPDGFEAVSNTPAAAGPSREGWRRVSFAETKPMPSYLVALAVGPFDSVPVEGFGVPGRILTPRGQKHLAALAARVTPPLLRATEAYFGSRYPYEKLDLIAVPDYWPGAMEHPGAITFADYVLLVDEKTATTAQRRLQARIAAHEFAHMWFGNLVTMSWWDEMWLNESFADWLGDKVADQVDPSLGVAASELQPVHQTMLGDSRATAVAIRRPVDDPNDAMRNVLLAYNKGKTVLGMFERFMGPDRFRDGVRTYMREHAWKNTASAQFWAALDRAAGSEASKALATFIEQPGLPLVRVERISANQVRLEQRRFGVAGSALSPQAWRIPVGLRWSDGRQGRVETVLLDGPERTVTLPAPDVAWVFPNADSAGYYRWDVPDADLRDLAAHAGQRLSTAERIGFLGNLAALLDAGEVGGREYLGVIERFGQDPEPEVVTAALGALAKLEPPFVSEANREAFASYVRRVFGPTLDRIGFEPKAGEPAAVTGARPALLTWLGDRGRDPRVLGWAQTTAERLRRDPAAVPASVAATALRLAASTGDAALFDEYRARFEGAQVPADRGLYLSAIAGFRDPKVRDRILAWAPTAGLRLNELVLVSNAFRATPAERDHVFEWMTASYDALSAAIPPGFRPGLANLAGGCEPERVARADAFFRDRDVAGVDKELAKVREQVGECVALRSREAEAIGAYLSGGRAAQP